MTQARVLIVEDETKIAQLLREYLEQSGFAVDTLARVDQAVGWVRQHSPDAVLLGNPRRIVYPFSLIFDILLKLW